jgi:hypothetical protein
MVPRHTVSAPLSPRLPIGPCPAAPRRLAAAGLTGMTKALALDEAKHGVRVNVISPGECTGPRPADTGAQDCWLVVLRLVTPSVDNAAGQAPPSSAAHHSDVASAPHMAVRCVSSHPSQATCGRRCGRSTSRATTPRSRRGRRSSPWDAWDASRRCGGSAPGGSDVAVVWRCGGSAWRWCGAPVVTAAGGGGGGCAGVVESEPVTAPQTTRPRGSVRSPDFRVCRLPTVIPLRQLAPSSYRPPQIGEAALHLAADATFTTGFEYLVTGGAELGYGVKA